MEIDVTLAIFRRAARFRPALATFVVAALMASASVAATAEAPSPSPLASADGVLRVQSMHGFDETVARLQSAIAGKGVKFFDAIDQAKLGADAGLPIGRSTLVLFGNPPLGVQFLQSNPYSALDWPVRMLVIEDAEAASSWPGPTSTILPSATEFRTDRRNSRWPAKSPPPSPQRPRGSPKCGS
jgi:hypothetical protein